MGSLVQCRYSGALFMIAAIILACAEHVAMIVIGRVFQGMAVSFFPKTTAYIPVIPSVQHVACQKLHAHVMTLSDLSQAQLYTIIDLACTQQSDGSCVCLQQVPLLMQACMV